MVIIAIFEVLLTLRGGSGLNDRIPRKGITRIKECKINGAGFGEQFDRSQRRGLISDGGWSCRKVVWQGQEDRSRGVFLISGLNN